MILPRPSTSSEIWTAAPRAEPQHEGAGATIREEGHEREQPFHFPTSSNSIKMGLLAQARRVAGVVSRPGRTACAAGGRSCPPPLRRRLRRSVGAERAGRLAEPRAKRARAVASIGTIRPYGSGRRSLRTPRVFLRTDNSAGDAPLATGATTRWLRLRARADRAPSASRTQLLAGHRLRGSAADSVLRLSGRRLALSSASRTKARFSRSLHLAAHRMPRLAGATMSLISVRLTLAPRRPPHRPREGF